MPVPSSDEEPDEVPEVDTDEDLSDAENRDIQDEVRPYLLKYFM